MLLLLLFLVKGFLKRTDECTDRWTNGRTSNRSRGLFTLIGGWAAWESGSACKSKIQRSFFGLLIFGHSSSYHAAWAPYQNETRPPERIELFRRLIGIKFKRLLCAAKNAKGERTSKRDPYRKSALLTDKILLFVQLLLLLLLFLVKGFLKRTDECTDRWTDGWTDV